MILMNMLLIVSLEDVCMIVNLIVLLKSVRVTLPSIGREERPLTTGNIIPVF